MINAALEDYVTAGYNVFTMNLIEGHYLGERRASQEQRCGEPKFVGDFLTFCDAGQGVQVCQSAL
jgi:hypothetical protein